MTPEQLELSDGKRIAVTDPSHLLSMGMTLGLLTALDAINKAEFDKLPGITVARCAVEAEEAKQRVHVMQRNLRLAAKHGVSIEDVGIAWSGKPEIVVIAHDRDQESER